MAKQNKKSNLTKRDKKKLRLRKKIKGSESKPRVCVFKSDKHTYAQLVSDVTGVTLASASTREADVLAAIGSIEGVESCNDSKSTKGVQAAAAVGYIVAQRAKAKGVEAAVFDRNGFLYHGRIKAVAEGARAGGLLF